MVATKALLKYIETAKEIENDGLRFYKKALKRVDDPNSKGLLRLLVKEEETHLEFFKTLKKGFGKGDYKKPAKALKSPLFAKDAYKKINKRRTDTIKVFQTALEMEEKGIKFYTKLSALVKDKKLSRFLKALAKMEMRHFKLIKQHQDSIYDAWYWEAMEMPALNT